jgi:hypothetical protein
MRFDPPSIKQRGALAKAVNQVYERRDERNRQDVSGRIPCTWCTGQVSFTVFPSGLSFGSCTSGCGIRWTQ